MTKRIVLLEIEEDRAQELIDALKKRSFVSVTEVPLTREARKKTKQCKLCNKPFGSERVQTVTPAVVELLLEMLEKMHIAKSVVLASTECNVTKLNFHERERAVVANTRAIITAEELGLIERYLDGRQETHFVTQRAMDFLCGETEISPSKLIVSEGTIIAKEGYMSFSDVAFEDVVTKDSKRNIAKRSIASLPNEVKLFVKSGQLPLI